MQCVDYFKQFMSKCSILIRFPKHIPIGSYSNFIPCLILVFFTFRVEPNVEEDEDNVSELNFSLPHVDEPINQKIDRGLQRENNNENVKEKPKAMKSGDSNQKSKSKKDSEVLKAYPKRVSRNKPPKYYGWSFYNPLNCV